MSKSRTKVDFDSQTSLFSCAGFKSVIANSERQAAWIIAERLARRRFGKCGIALLTLAGGLDEYSILTMHRDDNLARRDTIVVHCERILNDKPITIAPIERNRRFACEGFNSVLDACVGSAAVRFAERTAKRLYGNGVCFTIEKPISTVPDVYECYAYIGRMKDLARYNHLRKGEKIHLQIRELAIPEV